MLQVQAKFEDDLHTENMLKTSQIPCLCKIAEKFEIDFLVAYPQVTGLVIGWDYKEIDLRVSAGAGGEYLHYKYGLITISKLEDDLYIIENSIHSIVKIGEKIKLKDNVQILFSKQDGGRLAVVQMVG